MLTVKERIWSSLLTIAGWTEVLFCELQWDFGLSLPVGLYQEPVSLGKEEEVYERKQRYSQCGICGKKKTVWQCFPFPGPKL